MGTMYDASKNFAEKASTKFLCLESENCCDITNCNKIKWNPETMVESKHIGYNNGEYIFSHSIINIHSGEEYVHFKQIKKMEKPASTKYLPL